MGRFVSGRIAVAVLVAGLLAALAPSRPAGAGLVPHRAFYRLEPLAGRTPPATRVEGRLALEWRRTCGGWASRQRLAFLMAPDDAAPFVVDIRFRGFERLDGRRFDFAMETFEDGRPVERTEGRAWLPGTTRERGGLVLKGPEPRRLALPATTRFPARQMEELLAAARAGRALVDQLVYDGSGEEGLVRAVTLFGRPRDRSGRRLWPFVMGYHRPGDPAPLPRLQLWGEMDEGGVFRKLVLDFGDFALRAVPVRIRELPLPPCPARP